MTFGIEAPALLVYGDGTGRLVNPADLPTCLEDVCTRYMEDDLLIDRRGRVFRLSYSENEALVIGLLNQKLEPVDVTDRFTEAEMDSLLGQVKCDDPCHLEKVVSAIELSRRATW